MSIVNQYLSRWLRTDASYLAKNGSWLWVGRIITITILFATSIFFANVLDPSDLGTYQYIIALSGFFGLFALIGMNTSMVRSVARGAPGVLDYGVRTYLYWSAGTLGLGMLAALYYYWQGNTWLAAVIMIGATMIPIQRASGLYVAFVEGQQKFKLSILLGLIGSTVPTTAVVGTIFFTHNPIYLAGVSFISGALVNGGLYWFCRTRYKTNGAEPTAISEMISFSKHLSLIQFLARSLPYIERIVLASFTNPAMLAAYHFSSLVPKQFNEIDRVLKKLLMPKLSERDFSILKKTLPRKVMIYFILMLGIVTTYILLAPTFFNLIFPQYVEFTFHSQIFALSALLQPTSVFSRALTAHIKKRALYIQSTIIPIMTIIITCILIPMFGVWGAVFSKIAHMVIHSVVVIYFFFKTT